MLKIFTHDAYNEGHAYLLINDKNKKAVLIDTAGIGKQVIQYIIENKIILTDVVITHGHFDHIAELDNIYLATNKPKIWIGVGDEVCLTKLRYTISKTNKYGITPWEPKISFSNYEAIKTSTELLINDFVFNIIPSPGHTPGTLLIFVNEIGLFVGDTAFIDNVGYYEIPFANKSQFIDTLKLITTFEGNTIVYPRHWTPGFTVQHLIDNNNILNNLIKSKN